MWHPIMRQNGSQCTSDCRFHQRLLYITNAITVVVVCSVAVYFYGRLQVDEMRLRVDEADRWKRNPGAFATATLQFADTSDYQSAEPDSRGDEIFAASGDKWIVMPHYVKMDSLRDICMQITNACRERSREKNHGTAESHLL